MLSTNRSKAPIFGKGIHIPCNPLKLPVQRESDKVLSPLKNIGAIDVDKPRYQNPYKYKHLYRPK